MSSLILTLPIAIPLFLSLFVFVSPKQIKFVREAFVLIASGVNLVIFSVLFAQIYRDNNPINLDITGWIGADINFSLKIDKLSAFVLLIGAVIGFLVIVYTLFFMKGKSYQRMFYGFLLITLAFLNGTILANNLIVLLFFCEGLLITLFGMIVTGGQKSFPVAIKALVLSGTADLLLMLGIGMTIFNANGEISLDKLNVSLEDPLGCLSFLLLVLGAVGKAGAMPFHSWIPDAATEAPLPFMALVPAVFEKLIGVYVLARVTLDLFQFEEFSAMSYVIMALGAATLLFSVMMALVQRDIKRVLAYHAISQVGYIMLGIGSATPIGIVGGLFHMANHAMYKSGLFLIAGNIERQTGTTDMRKIGGLARKMPVTFLCFIIAAASYIGVPPFNGFFSKELIFDGALEISWVFYLVAAAGAFFAALSFFRLGHSVFLSKLNKETEKTVKETKEAPLFMIVPTLLIAAGCILFGVYNALPIQSMIEPILGHLPVDTYAGFPHNLTIVAISVGLLIGAFLCHLYGVNKERNPLNATSYLYNAPILRSVYRWADRRYLDPYDIGMGIVKGVSKLLFMLDRAIDWVLCVFLVKAVGYTAGFIRKCHNGSYSRYIIWAFLGLVVLIFIAFQA